MNELLIKTAIEAQKLAKAPYSKFKVGAAVLLKDGKIIKGANIENAAFGASMCGERNAIFGAYCQGYKKSDIVAIAITANCDPIASPCGTCRQVLFELCPLKTPVYLANNKGKVIETTVKELLPLGFSSESMK
ncbi:MAG: cytidine deaminase [Bacilli bacterium]|nr:cytidine deaminase [Bacilli bacterium]MDD3422527.1 cytidine deaminase [Bacilli bacterium]MDD4065471.1 cytidine deaminase [Bacilli bacterium]